MTGRCTSDVDGAKEVGLNLCAEVRWREFFEEAGVKVPRVVDEHINETELPSGVSDRGFRVVFASDVELNDV